MRLHVIDGTYELFRAFYSKRPPHADAKGRDVKATVGVASSIFALLDDPDERPTHLAVAFDNPIVSFRNDLFEGYKTGEGVDLDLLAQFGRVEEAMRAMGVVVWSMDKWEADDALATAAARWQNDVEQVRIMTPDKDLGQCIRGTRVIQVDRMRKKIIDEDALLIARGIKPESIPDYLALVGDTADGIPGIPGFGKKTAAALLRAYTHLESIPRRASEWSVNLRGGNVLAETLVAKMEDAKLFRTLATLACDVPLVETLDDLRWCGVPKDAFVSWCNEIRASDSMRSRVDMLPRV